MTALGELSTLESSSMEGKDEKDEVRGGSRGFKQIEELTCRGRSHGAHEAKGRQRMRTACFYGWEQASGESG